jgi:hypothetical protein
VEVEPRTGDLLEPLAGERFDLVVSNPPFVVSPGARYVYRDAGLDGDDVCRRWSQELPAVLAPGAQAVLLANWLHVEGEDGDERVRSWFGAPVATAGWCSASWPPRGLRDRLAARHRRGITLRRAVHRVGRLVRRAAGRGGGLRDRRPARGRAGPGGARRRRAADRRHLGGAGRCPLRAMDLLESSLLNARLRLRDDVRLHQVGRPGPEGWEAESSVLQQSSGLRWSGGVDAYGAQLLAGCDGTRRLGELVSVLAGSAGLTDAEAAEQVLPVVERLVEQGFLVG